MTAFAELPHDVLRRVLQAVDLRTLLSMSATCTALYAVSTTVSPLKPCITPATSPARQIQWMALPHVGPRVASLRISRALRHAPGDAPGDAPEDADDDGDDGGSTAWLHTLTHMRSFVTAFCRVPPAVFHSLRPETLLNMDIHQLVPQKNDDDHDVFSTAVLARFTNLRRCHITFGAGWSLAMVGKGIDAMPHLRSLSLRRAPALAVTRSITATDVHLYATDVLACRVPIAPRATSLRLECDDHPVDLHAMQLPADTLEFLEVRSEDIVDVPALTRMTRLATLDVRARVFVVPDMRALTSLRRLCVDVSYCFVVGERSALPRSVENVSARAAGIPFDLCKFTNS